MSESFMLGDKKMVLDRGRYKEAKNKGSVSTNKQSFFEKLFSRSAKPKVVKEARAASTGDRGIGEAFARRAETIDYIDKEIAKQYK